MITNPIVRTVLAALLGAITAACSPQGTEDTSSLPNPTRHAKPLVLTTFYPTQYFTERIAGDLVDVVCPVPDGEDPIFWMPDDPTLLAYQQADLIILNGAGFAKWVDVATLPAARMVDTANPLADQFIRFKNAVTHSHGPSGQHSHTGLDGHTWLDPVNAGIQAGEILKALKSLLPDHTAELDAGFESLAGDLGSLDAGFKDLTASTSAPPLFASHPAYNYLARRYGWNIRNFTLDPASPPDESQIRALQKSSVDHDARAILWESPPLPATAKQLKNRLNLDSIVFSPCELLDPESRKNGADYLSVMRQNLKNLRAAFE